jgi:hypothetical protein
MKLKVLALILVMLNVSACDYLISNDDVLSLDRQNYHGNELLLNGIFYEESSNDKDIYYQRYAFYKNGIIRDLLSSTDKDSKQFPDGNHKTEWGVFQIIGNEIKFERWYPSSGGPLHAYIRSGIILNDTTFLITESYRMQKGIKTEVKKKNETYHFRKFSPKPDSTNRFIP